VTGCHCSIAAHRLNDSTLDCSSRALTTERLCVKVVSVRSESGLTEYAWLLLSALVKRSQSTLHTASERSPHCEKTISLFGVKIEVLRGVPKAFETERLTIRSPSREMERRCIRPSSKHVMGRMSGCIGQGNTPAVKKQKLLLTK
jgi:hypothetical protein